jgi:hypothetical protein
MSIQRKDLRISRSFGHEQSLFKPTFSLSLDLIHAESSVSEVKMEILPIMRNHSETWEESRG